MISAIRVLSPTNQKRKSAGLLLLGAFAFALLLCLPIFTLLVLSIGGDLESFVHIAANVMPGAGLTTILLMAGVGFFVAIVGTATAWAVTYLEFPMRRTLQWMLVLPFAVPTYISAYAFVEFFSYTGPLQTLIRGIGGFQSSRDYWFPEIRSMWGTIFVMGVVLYPYIYLSVRALFHIQGESVSESARLLGASGLRLLVRVTVPMARPAIMLGVVLALMETINDIGAVEYLGTHTLTFSVFSVWLNQNDLSGAAQIALFLLIIVFILICMEYISRGARKFHSSSTRSGRPHKRAVLGGAKGSGVTALVFLPIFLGFGIPCWILLKFAIKDIGDLFSPPIVEALVTSISLGLIAAILAVLGGLLLSYVLRLRPDKYTFFGVRVASVGYAIPGTLVALGIFIPVAAFDNYLDGVMREAAGISTGLLLTGSGAALIFAYVVRFMAMAEGNLENGFSKISPNLDMAARSLGQSNSQVLVKVLLPIMKPAIAGAAVLVFVDVIKELSATILLRPFGMNTLATHVYDYASQARVEDAALGCLLIIAAGIVPTVILVRSNRLQ